MNVSRHHAVAVKQIDDEKFYSIIENMTNLGFVSLRNEIASLTKIRLESVDFPFSPRPFVWDGELLINSERGSLVAIRNMSRRASMARRSRGQPASQSLDIVVTSRGDSDYTVECLIQSVRDLLDVELQPHSVQEAGLGRMLSKRLKGLSPNGRLLGESGVKQGCKKLEDEHLRRNVAAVVQTFQEQAVPVTALARLDEFAENQEALDTFLSEESVVAKTFGLHCSSCEQTHVVFPNEESARRTIAESDAKCGSCGKEDLTVLNIFGVRRPILRALRQGVWLESLTEDALKSRTDLVWSGQMADRDELDVVAVLADQVVLVECKDTSFGQNELYVTLAKAQNIGANEIIIVSTKDIHSNVWEAIRELNENADSRRSYDDESRKIHVIEERASLMIKSKLEETIETITMKCLGKWVAGGPSVFQEYGL